MLTIGRGKRPANQLEALAETMVHLHFELGDIWAERILYVGKLAMED